MQKYINQLIQSFKKAEENPTVESDFSDNYPAFEKQMLEMEESQPQPAKEIVGIGYEELPPAERMTVAQTQQLLEAMLNALSAKGTDVIFPGDGVPVKLAYEQLREYFKEGFYASTGWLLDLCEGWCPDCAFADYCKIKDDIWTEEKLKAERKESEGLG
ncbi:MAG: hypothetical protein B7C24_17975 [Bacteroidetes bacterium 4572_77]|nr:MAG: hypothetical protein B7C24_17975 [Bacteroidetes bacterium 4572_77]